MAPTRPQSGLVHYPSGKGENKLAHRVALRGLACEPIQAVLLIERSSYVFPSRVRPGFVARYFSGASRVKRSQLRLRPRDLRRRAASHRVGPGIPRLVAVGVLNHAGRDVTAVYDRHSYDGGKGVALGAWECKLLRVNGILHRGPGQQLLQTNSGRLRLECHRPPSAQSRLCLAHAGDASCGSARPVESSARRISRFGSYNAFDGFAAERPPAA